MSDVLVKVEDVSKKFCRSLKRSLWYGVQDICADLNPFRGDGSSVKIHSLSDRKTSHALNTNGATDPATSVFNIPMADQGQDGLRPDEFWAVKDVSFELKRGECLGLIGHNGAGKTTLLKMLNGLIKPDKGRIEMRGRVGALIALGAGFNPILTGRENIYVNGSVLGLTKRQIDGKIDELIEFAEIAEFIDSPVQSYSSGMAVRLGFAIAVHSRPDVLLLDEVLAVGDIGFQAKCFNTLSEFRRKGTAFVLVSHNLHNIVRYCDQIVYLKRGRITHFGDVDTGINHFIGDMNASECESETGFTDWYKVYGSGKVVLKAARFLNEAGEEITEIRPGDIFSLAIDYECPSGDVEDTVLDLKICDREGVLFQATSENYGVDFGRLDQQGRFLVTFQSVPVNAAEIRFFFALLSKGSAEVYDWKRHVRLKVANLSRLTGRLALSVHWELISARENRRQGAVSQPEASTPES